MCGGFDPIDAARLQGVLVHDSYIYDRMLIRLYWVHILEVPSGAL